MIKMKQNAKFGIFILSILMIALLVISCKPGTIKPGSNLGKKTDTTQFESQELKKFSSAQELIDYLEKNSKSQGTSYGGFAGGIRSSVASAMMEKSAAPQTADSGASATDYSTTNVQVQGVDEADFVKNDGKYIYTIVQDKLVIVNAYPAETAEILSKTEIQGRPRDILLNKDRLVIFAEDEDKTPMIPQYDIVPVPSYSPKTHVFVYDISNREKPKLLKDYNIKGSYFESRMIDNYVYFISRENVNYYGGPRPLVDMPAIKLASTTIFRPDVYYFPNPENDYVFHTVASFDIFGDEKSINAKTFMLGYSNTLYVSQNNIYISYQKNLPWRYYEDHNEQRFYEVIVPLLPNDVQSKINDVKNSNQNSYEKWDKISDILEEMYNKMGENEKEQFIEKAQDAITDYETKLEIERRKTVIQKIRIDKGDIEYVAKGEVPGYLLNQFSMDENGKYFRVATTMEFYGRNIVKPMVGAPGVAESKIAMPIRPPESRNNMYNNVYVLDEKMNIVGTLEGLAPDERIYSTRFLGDRLYMVTFKRVDPLFVIDLSNPEKPEVLGKLKIPGFSDYLHPYDETHIIGIGKETEANDWGGISTRGVKLALFDVSDVENPKELDKYEIGEAGTDSEALREHKAFLFDKKKNLLVIPVTEIKGKQIYDSRYGYYRQRIWQGAYVFDLTLEKGFEVKGKITHNEGDDLAYWWDSPNVVRRSLFMDDVLYTVSPSKIKANDLNDVSKEIKEIKLPYEQPKNYPYPVVY